MKVDWQIYTLLLLLIMMPVIQLSGHFINLSEFYLYIMFLINLKHYRVDVNARVILTYLVLFLLVCVLTSLQAGAFLNNHDFFILRNGFQFFMAILIFNYLLGTSVTTGNVKAFERLMRRCLTILSLPALIVFLQRFNVFGFRELVIFLYKPQFFFLKADMFMEFRYTSVFKDFFTAAVYFTILTSSIYYLCVLKASSFKNKIFGIVLVLVNYSAQFFVARTSLLMIPVSLFLMSILSGELSVFLVFKRILFFILLIAPVLGIVGLYTVESGGGNLEWIMGAFNLYSLDSQSFQTDSSFTVMQDWNEGFLDSIFDNPLQLIVPHHTYNLTETANPGLYSDGFYPQEVYRYGIYGILAYLFMIKNLIKNNFKKNKAVVVWTLIFVLLNYKGGNVFFMPKNIYMYGFVFAVSSVYLNVISMGAKTDEL